MVVYNPSVNYTGTRRVTLLTDPYTNTENNLPWVMGQDSRGFGYSIALDALPPGVNLEMIKQTQVWYVSNDSGAYRLVYYGGSEGMELTISGLDTGLVASGTTNVVSSGTSYYGSFYDTTTQTLVSGSGVGIPMLFNSVDDANGFIISRGSQITAQQFGVYNLEFSAQLNQTDNSSDQVNIWLRTNGVDVPESNTLVNMPKQSAGNYSTNVAAWNWFVTLASGDYTQIMWVSPDSTSVVLQSSGSTSYAPAVPSVIATIQQITQVVGSGGSLPPSAALTVRIDTTPLTSSGFVYEGEAYPGTTTSVSGWRITKVITSGTGAISLIYPSGNGEFKWIWDDRTGYTYS